MKPGGLLEAIVELSHERGLEQEAIIEAIEDAIIGAAYRKYKNYKNIDATFNLQTGNIDLLHYKTVVEELRDDENEISLAEAQSLDPLAECGDEVEYEIDSTEFVNVIAQTARQLIFQKINEAERESVSEKYSEKVGEILHGTVSRVERGRIIILIGNSVEASLEKREQIPGEKLQPGDHVRALLLKLNPDGRGPQLLLSRTHPKFLIKLFEVEVPEVYDGLIEVIAASREPGRRAKVAVHTTDPDIDPVGACVGVRGSRIQAVVSELCGERIDVIEWSQEMEQFIANALAPADIVEMELDEENCSANIYILPDQLSLAIGKQGQNVRLASRLTGITINIVPWEKSTNLEDLLGSDEEEEKESSQEESTQQETVNVDAESQPVTDTAAVAEETAITSPESNEPVKMAAATEETATTSPEPNEPVKMAPSTEETEPPVDSSPQAIDNSTSAPKTTENGTPPLEAENPATDQKETN